MIIFMLRSNYSVCNIILKVVTFDYLEYFDTFSDCCLAPAVSAFLAGDAL